MDLPATNVRPPAAARPGRRDQIVVLRNIPWKVYDGLCKAREDSAGPRMAYLDGTLEIMSPARKHEYEKTLIARLVETYAEETGLSLNGYGSETFREEAKDAGVEPDECYCVGPAKKFPDFAIEVINKSGDIDKLEIYRRLKVTEVWFWKKGRFLIYRLVGRRYALREKSEVLPGLDLEEISGIVVATDESHQTEAVRAYRRTLRRRG
jgi:Uma2 family endonuclease